MDVNQEEERIYSIAKVLLLKKMDETMKSVSDYFQIAKELEDKYPDLTAEEIGEIYEKQCEEKAKIDESR